MVSTDPIADMFTRIRNAAAVNKSEVALPYSKIKENIARLLVDNGFLNSVNVTEGDKNKVLNIVINDDQRSAALTEINRLSTPGRRLYVKASEMPEVKRGRGIVIVSTSKGLMTGTAAKQGKLGGELICEVY